MLTQQHAELDRLLRSVAEELDIKPTDYQRAVRSYGAVGRWLQEGHGKGFYPGSKTEPRIYPQGSINLGTVVRPVREGKERDFDVDLVCELQVPHTLIAPAILKKQVGDCLGDNETYRAKMEPEGKRCWTLTYAEAADYGFHIDILPCTPDLAAAAAPFPGAIRITHRHKAPVTYVWRPSNPEGYAQWFRSRNTAFAALAPMQKQAVFDNLCRTGGKLVFASVKEVPDQLVRTPLQRAIQLMKRHRDMRFAPNPEFKPISIIITTVAASLYQGEADTYAALTAIVEALALHAGLIESQYFRINEKLASLKLITRTANGKWWLPNPADSHENFADKWHEDNHARARAFFQWVAQLRADVAGIPVGRGLSAVNAHLKTLFGERASTAAIGRIGDSLRDERDRGSLKMQTGTGVLGAAGSVAVKAHTFYGQ